MKDYEYIFSRIPCGLWDFKKKEDALSYHVRYMLARTQSMFKYEGLPETIPARIMELLLQVNGYAGVFRYKDNLYACFGSLGGEPDYNYMPTVFTVSNPALKYSANLKINEDCIIIKNDSMYTGLLPMLRRYGTALLENELSMNIVSIMTRLQSLISASDDATKASAEKFLNRIAEGNLGIVGDMQFFENLKVQPYASNGSYAQIMNLIEYEQYLKASEFNEIGLDANYNMKRETLTDSENEMNRDSLLPLIDDMLACREEGVKAINEMFGTDIRVSFNSAWEDNAQELDFTHAFMKAEAEEIKETPEEQEKQEEQEEKEEQADDEPEETE